MTIGVDIAPTRLEAGGKTFEIRPFARGDREAVHAFARALPVHDLLFLKRDIRQEKVVDTWLQQIDEGLIGSLLAVDPEGRVHACTALVRDRLSWSSHVADVRILVDVESRRMGLGRLLALHCVDAALGESIEKLTVQMTPDQEGARKMFEEIGFRPEALLREQVRDATGEAHDLLILALSLERFSATQSVYSL